MDIGETCETEQEDNVFYRMAARVASVVFHPFFMPLYAVLILLYGNTFISIFPVRVKLYIILITVLCTILLPGILISIIKKLGVISSVSLDDRNDRSIPMLIVAACYVLCTHLLSNHLALQMVNQVLLGGLIALGVCFFVTFFWKISMHMTAIGGVTGLMFAVNMFGFGYLPLMLALFFLASGILGSSRLYLGKHTLWQVASGFVVGFVVMITVLRF